MTKNVKIDFTVNTSVFLLLLLLYSFLHKQQILSNAEEEAFSDILRNLEQDPNANVRDKT
jgi:hypothetical protein